MSSAKEGSPVSELAMREDVRQVAVPFPRAQYQCPSCEAEIPTRKQIRLAKPAKFESELNDILKCPYCAFIFSPKANAFVMTA